MDLEALIHQAGQIFGHDTLIQGGEAGALQLVGKGSKVGKAVQLTPLAKCARPGKDGGHGVGGGLLSL